MPSLERYASVPKFRISVINHNFCACEDHELPSFDAARKQAIGAALAIGSDEVMNGTSFFGAEVRVEGHPDKLVRFIVSVGASHLQ